MTKNQLSALSVGLGKKISTEELASIFLVNPDTPRAALCRKGVWMGLRPIKLPNGRLMWDAAEVERLISGEVA